MSNNSTTYVKILSKGVQANLPEIEDGKLRFTTDTGRLFLDNGGNRIEITDLVKGKTKEEILNIENPLPKLYLSSDTHELLFNVGSEWSGINASSVANASTAGYAINAGTSSYATNASTTDYSKNAINSITRDGLTFTATRYNGSTFMFDQNNTTYGNFSTASAGLAPASDGSTASFLRADGSWTSPGSGGSDVSIETDLSSGTKIATMTINAATTALYAPPAGYVTQQEVQAGAGDILISNGSTYGEARKNPGLNYNINNKWLILKSAQGDSAEPEIIVWDEYNHSQGTGSMMWISANDISISETTEEEVHADSWDGTNESLKASIRSIQYYGTTTPSPGLGRNGSVYFKMSTDEVSPDREVVEIYYKQNDLWSKYSPILSEDYDFGVLDEPVPEDTLLYDWDFTESMIDKVEGRENVPGANIPDFSYEASICLRDNEKGLYVDGGGYSKAPIAEIPVDLRYPGYKIEIEFGDYSMYYSDYLFALIGSYSNPESWAEEQYDELSIGFGFYDENLQIYSNPSGAGLITGSEVVDVEQDPTYFANSKVTIKTVAIETPSCGVIDPDTYQYSGAWYSASYSYNVAWEVYKDDELVGITPPKVIGQYLSGLSDPYAPAPNSAELPTMGYWTSYPAGFYNGISFGVPCSGDIIEIKSLKIWRVNNNE